MKILKRGIKELEAQIQIQNELIKKWNMDRYNKDFKLTVYKKNSRGIEKIIYIKIHESRSVIQLMKKEYEKEEGIRCSLSLI